MARGSALRGTASSSAGGASFPRRDCVSGRSTTATALPGAPTSCVNSAAAPPSAAQTPQPEKVAAGSIAPPDTARGTWACLAIAEYSCVAVAVGGVHPPPRQLHVRAADQRRDRLAVHDVEADSYAQARSRRAAAVRKLEEFGVGEQGVPARFRASAALYLVIQMRLVILAHHRSVRQDCDLRVQLVVPVSPARCTAARLPCRARPRLSSLERCTTLVVGQVGY